MAAQGADLSTRLKILFVINDLYTRGNGLAASARRTIMLLRERGHDVRVLSTPPSRGDDCGVGMPDYPLPHLRIPLVAPLIASQGCTFARSDRRQVDRALDWGTWCIWRSRLCCRLSLLGVRALVVCRLWRPIIFIRKT